MKITIDTDDICIFETYDDYAKEYANAKEPGHRRWGRVSWLYPGDMLVEISNPAAQIILDALKNPEPSVEPNGGSSQPLSPDAVKQNPEHQTK